MCKKYSWPVSSICKYCASLTIIKPISRREGKVLEYCTIQGTEDIEAIGLIEIGQVKVIGKILDPRSINVGDTVRLVSCGISADGSPYYDFETVLR